MKTLLLFLFLFGFYSAGFANDETLKDQVAGIRLMQKKLSLCIELNSYQKKKCVSDADNLINLAQKVKTLLQIEDLVNIDNPEELELALLAKENIFYKPQSNWAERKFTFYKDEDNQTRVQVHLFRDGGWSFQIDVALKFTKKPSGLFFAKVEKYGITAEYRIIFDPDNPSELTIRWGRNLNTQQSVPLF